MEFKNLKIKNIDCVVNYKPEALKWACVKRKNHIIGVKLYGKSEHDLGYQKFTISENCIYFLNQRDDYTVKLLEKGEVISVHFTTYEPIETDSFCIKLNNIAEIMGLLEKIRIQKALTTNGENLVLSYFYRVCAAFEDYCQKKYTPGDMRMINAKEYIDLHFHEKNCLELAANTCNISRRRFNELFKKQFDITPNRYIIMSKVNFSKQLLKTSNLSVSEISNICGFSDIYYFSKVFRKETGYPPSKYKPNYTL